MWRALYSEPGKPLGALEKKEEILQAAASARGILWLDMTDPSPEEVGLLSSAFKLDPLAVEDIVDEIHHPKVDDYGDYIYLSVHGVRPGSERGDIQTCELDVVLSNRWLITHGAPGMRSINESWERALKAKSLPGGSAAETLQTILATQASHHVDEVEGLQKDLAVIEEELLETGPREQGAARRVFRIKADLARLRLILGAQREVVHRLGRGDFAVVPKHLLMHFRDVYDDLYRAAEMTDLLRDIAHSAVETHLNLVANRTNEIMKVLTIIACIILPMTLVTGWYGMNFHHLTGLDWKYAELYVLALFAVITLGFGWFLRRKGWI
jgi:magnesium transporter